MNWKSFLVGTAAGLAAGIMAKELLAPLEHLSPEKVLSTVKERVKKEGSIYGSWIMMKPETIEKDGLTYEVYRGGVTRNLDDRREQFEFIADSHTGTIVELTLQRNE